MKLFFVLCSILMLSGVILPPEPATTLPTLYFVPEMERIAQVDNGGYVPPEECVQESQRVAQEWHTHFLWIQTRLSPQKVRDLSGWAKVQMQTYSAVPNLGELTLQPIAIKEEEHNLIFEGVIDTLPTHSPLVKRWLKLYLVYNLDRQEILSIYITIRGQVEE